VSRFAHFYADLERINATLHSLDAVVTDADGFVSVDESKVPAEVLRSYRFLAKYGAANGLLTQRETSPQEGNR
jgi:hypothetical protein